VCKCAVADGMIELPYQSGDCDITVENVVSDYSNKGSDDKG
jgi:hypothetical protein